MSTDPALTAEDKQLLELAHRQMSDAQAVLSFVGNHFRIKYNLPVNARIKPDGTIELASALDGQVREAEIAADG